MAGYTRRQSAAPGSRNGSRPPSRTGSNLSLDSEDSPRGGVRRTSSMRSGASAGRPPYRQTPVGFGSSTPRKTSTPATNGKGRTPCIFYGQNIYGWKNPYSYHWKYHPT